MTATFPLLVAGTGNKKVWKALEIGLACLLVFSLGCGVAIATWISLASNLIATVLPTIPGLIASFGALGGKTLTPAQVARLTGVFQGVSDLFSQANQLVAQYQANPDPSTVAKVRGLVTQIQTRLSSVLADLQITDAATVAKIQASIDAFTALANSILTVLPTVTGGKVTARHVSRAQMKEITPEAWAAKFNQSMQKRTGNALVDGAFANVKAVPVTK
jgi:hypothetical protein